MIGRIMRNGMKRVGKRWTGILQLLPVQDRKAAQQLFAVRCELDQNLAPILFAVAADDSSALDEAVNQLHCAVMTQAQTG